MTNPVPASLPTGQIRRTCARCFRPLATCLCRFVTPIDSAVELLILQHPLEVKNAKGSARLLHLCVGRSQLAIGETFDQGALANLLNEGGRTPVLLYPDTADHASLGLPKPATLDPAGIEPNTLRLVILDGTWRKSRKMLFSNPVLQALPRYALRAMPPSHYRIRKAHAADQLSTLEASCYALAQIEGGQTKFQPLLTAFDAFVGCLEVYQNLGNSRSRNADET